MSSIDYAKMFEELKAQAYAQGVADGREFQKADEERLKQAVKNILSKSQGAEESPWNSMDSAPRDGRKILALEHNLAVTSRYVASSSSTGCWVSLETGRLITPKYWMEFPQSVQVVEQEPPKSPQQNAEEAYSGFPRYQD